MASALKVRSEHRVFDGALGFYSHESTVIGSTMRFAAYVPRRERGASPPPVLYCLAGLTCNEETFLTKSGAIRYAAAAGLALVACDTSPRGLNLPGEDASWDFGVGAGFYVDAELEPWRDHYRMGTYVNLELPDLIEQKFDVADDRRGITGHSMGGHGALVLALRDPSRWRSTSAFAPIANPSVAPWGVNAFTRFLGSRSSLWDAWDASALMRARPHPSTIRIDQGLGDQFLGVQLFPEALERAARDSGQRLQVNRHDGYDHSYWFIQTFVEQHVLHHAAVLRDHDIGSISK